jgi:hypothetical protein
MELTDGQLHRYSAEHVSYEIHMLFRSALGFGAVIGDSFEAHTIRNALMEAFAIHARNLLDFLYEKPRGDDASACHYLKDPAEWWTTEKPTVPDHLRRRVNKEVTHLTYERLKVPPDKKRWPFMEVLKPLSECLDLWAAKADPSRLAQDCLTAIAQLRGAVAAHAGH